MGSAWFLALMLSWAFKVWGVHHPEPFQIRSILVFILIFAPSIFLGAWVYWFGFLRFNELSN